MSKKLLAFLGLASLAMLACQQDALAPKLASTNATPAAVAGGVETNVSIPLNLVVFISCANGGAGESVSLDGALHILLNTTIDDQGGAHLKEHFQPQGLTGTGQTTGDKYQGVGVTQDELNVVAGTTFSSVNNFRMIGQGPGNNFQVHENVQITVNANGTVTVTHDNLTTSCS